MTYNELRAALSAAMKRTDPETISNEPTALELARTVIAKTFFPVESEEVAVPDLPTVAGVGALPVDFGRAIAVGDDLLYVSPRQWRRATGNLKGMNGRYSIYNGELHVHPWLTAVALVYNQLPMPIIGTGENWLSQVYPSVWLHAARAEQYRFIEDIESAAAADNQWRGLAAEISQSSETSRQAGGALRMKSR